MSDKTQLVDDVRRALRDAADALVVDEAAFDPDRTTAVGLDAVDPDRPARRLERTVLVAAVVVVLVVAATLVVRDVGTSGHDIHVGDEPTSSSVPTTGGSASAGAPSRTPAPDALVEQVVSVPTDVLRAVGAGTSTASANSIRNLGPQLTKDGRPRIVWIGAEYCPFCAAERWPLIVALSRFGTFSNLSVTSSARDAPGGVQEVYPGTQTFSFYRSAYSSPYVTFESVEQQDNLYEPLESPTAEQAALVAKYDSPPYTTANDTGAIPFIDFANNFLVSGSTYSPALLEGMSAPAIAAALSDPASPVAKAVDGSANVFTAAICSLTGGRPASVCSDPALSVLGPTGPR